MEKVHIPAGAHTHSDLDDLALTVCRPMLKRLQREAMKWFVSILRPGCFAWALTCVCVCVCVFK